MQQIQQQQQFRQESASFNVDDSGNFGIQVLEVALQVKSDC